MRLKRAVIAEKKAIKNFSRKHGKIENAAIESRDSREEGNKKV